MSAIFFDGAMPASHYIRWFFKIHKRC